MVHLTHYNRLLITRFTHPKKIHLKKVWSMWDPIERRRYRFMHLSMFLNLNLYPRRTKPPNYFFFYLIFLGNLLGDEENKRGQLFVWQVVFAPSKAEKRLISASIAKKRIFFELFFQTRLSAWVIFLFSCIFFSLLYLFGCFSCYFLSGLVFFMYVFWVSFG